MALPIRLRRVFSAVALGILLLAVAGLLQAQTESPAAHAASGGATNSHTLSYTLPPGKLSLARSLYRWRSAMDFIFPLWSILVLLAILNFRWAAGMRDWAVALTSKPWLQGLLFLPPLLLLLELFDLPLSIVAHHVSLEYGQSIQAWGSWSVDWLKGLALDLVSGTLTLSVVFAIIRASRRWWLWIWLVSLPAQLLVVFILPVVVDPMFNHFEPLSQSDPGLVQQLERVVAKTGENIPPSRMYLMKASEKVTSANAYVTGFGASKRVVVWDTTIKSAPTNEVLLVFGHELGHYVLHHILRGLILGSIFSFFFLWAGFHLARFWATRYGARWHLTSMEDWAATALALLVFSILMFLAEPLGSAISRRQEHQADVFGQEVVHGIVADPQTVDAQAFQRMGEQSLDYPYPNRFIVFWTYSHPPLGRRESFAANYDPWQPGKHPRFFRRDGRLLAPHLF